MTNDAATCSRACSTVGVGDTEEKVANGERYRKVENASQFVELKAFLFFSSFALPWFFFESLIINFNFKLIGLAI